MKFIVLLTLLLSSTLAVLADKSPSNVNLAIDYSKLDILKHNVIKPLVTEKLKNLHLPDVHQVIKGVHVDLTNIVIQNVSIDWESSRLLTIGDQSNSTLILKDIEANVIFNFKAATISQQNSKMNIILDVIIALGFSNKIQDVFYTEIVNFSTPIKHFKVDFKSWTINLIEKLLGTKLDKMIENMLHDKIVEANTTLVEKTSQPIVVNKTDPVEFHLSLANLPEIFYYVFYDEKRIVQTFNWNVQAFKDKERYNPFSSCEVMPSLYTDFAPVQLIINDEILEVAIWTVYQRNVINFILSDADTNSSLGLYTESLLILFPDLVTKYGSHKGAYLKITKGGDYPMAKLSDGRLLVKGALNLEFFVDKDSSQYPEQGLENCTSCEKAVGLNVTLLVSAAVYKMDHQHIGLHIMNFYFPAIETTTGDYDGNSLKEELNQLLLSITRDLNLKTKNGISIPKMLAKYGVNATDIITDEDRLILGLDIDYQKDMAIEY